MGIDDESVLSKFEEDETKDPFPRKELSDRTIYMSRPMRFSRGLPAITDLSEARLGSVEHVDDIMPDVYRAPEVILGMPWSYPVDIWALGMVVSLKRVSTDPSYRTALLCRSRADHEYRYGIYSSQAACSPLGTRTGCILSASI